MKSTRVFYLLTFLIGQYALVHGQDSSTMTTLTAATTGTTQPTAVVQTTSEQVTNGQASTEPSTAPPATATATATAAATDTSMTTTTITTTVPATTTTTRPATTMTTSTGAPPDTTEPITTVTESANTTTQLIIRTVRPTPSNPTWKIVGGLAGGLAGIGLIGMVGGIYICYKSSNGRVSIRGRSGSKIDISREGF